MSTISRKIAYVALFTALGVVLNFLSFSVPPFGRASFVYFFCTFAGIVLGPWLGFASATMADLIPAIFFPQGPWMPLLTLSQGLMGLIPGLVFRYVRWKSFTLKLIVSSLASFLICTLGVGAAGSVPLLESFFKTAIRWGEELGIRSPYLMIVIYKAATQPFWIVINGLITAAVYNPVRSYLARHGVSASGGRSRKADDRAEPSGRA